MSTLNRRDVLLFFSDYDGMSLVDNIGLDHWNVTKINDINSAKKAIFTDNHRVGIVFMTRYQPDFLRCIQELVSLGKHVQWIAMTDDITISNPMVRETIVNHFYDYQRLPIDMSRLLPALCRAYGMSELARSIARNYDTSIEKNYILIGKSTAMKNVRQQIIKMAPVEKTVLITGESGTGKELAARALHQFSQRAKGPWITVNSAALPANLIQSELFGYERGAFTGANRFKMGKIEAANEGTILLDEIGDIAPDVQIALLRFLQEKTIERLGGTESIGLNVRVIAATHRDLKRAVVEGTFREDLYYRLNTLHLQMPPLREREDDIIDLAYCFLEKFLREQNKSKPRDFSIEALRVMRVHNWPGNVRELINRVERAVLFCDDRLIAPKHLDLDRRNNSRQIVTIEEARKRAEHDAIHIAIQHANGNLTRAAKVLGISRASLYRLCKFNVEMNENNQAHRKLRK